MYLIFFSEQVSLKKKIIIFLCVCQFVV
jgi:hypothetical protein